MDSKRSARVWIVTALMALTTTVIGAADQDRGAEEPWRSGPTITGSWLETITPNGGSPFSALDTYGEDGVWISSAQGGVITGPPSPASFTPAQGQWTPRGGRTFSTTAVSLGSDLTDGHLLVVFKIRQTVTLNRSGNAYRSVFRYEILDPAGNLLFVLEGTSEAHRIGVEPLN
jgi:hypothetical protein